MFEPRKWQRDCLRLFGRTTKDLLIVVTPGGGKTSFACEAGRGGLRRDWQQIIVVVPTRALCEQWVTDAHEHGLSLTYDWDGQGAPRGFDGVVVTYAAVTANPAAFRILSGRNSALVIFDEIHHAGEGKSWGDALRFGFAPAVRRLLLSGTPFRSDNNPIPFVEYKDGHCVPDFHYGYRDALADGIVRPVHFPHFNGEFVWWSYGEEHEASFDEKIERSEVGRRLRTAVQPGCQWMLDVLREADEELDRIRDRDPDAGGLLLAIDTKHARALAQDLKGVTGEGPTIVCHDDAGANDKIKAFRKSDKKWIVAIKMVSEGVDIKRLRVIVYATRTVSGLFFRQAIGRAVRVREESPAEQESLVFMPADSRLLEHATSIENEVLDVIEDRERAIAERGDDADAPGAEVMFLPSTAESATHDGTIVGSEVIAGDEIRAARTMAGELGRNIDAATLVGLWRCFSTQPQAAPIKTPKKITAQDERHQLRKLAARKLQYLVRAIHGATPPAAAWQRLNGRLAKKHGPVKEASNDQLRARIAEIETMLTGQQAMFR